MKRFINYLTVSCFIYTLILATPVFGHITEFAYCFDCNGNVTIYIDQWHNANGPAGTNSINLSITVNGTTTTYNNMTPNGTSTTTPGTNGSNILPNTSFNNLPNCQGSRQLVGQCQQNNDWDVFYFPAMPRGVPIKIQITGSSNFENSNACGDMSNIATFYIPINPVASKSGNFCVNQSTKLSVHTTKFTNTITQSNGTVISHPVFDTTHSVQWQSSTSPTGPWTNMVGPGANSQVLPLGPLQVLGTMYYQAVYLSSSTKQIVPAHNDTIQAVHATKPDGTDTIVVPYHINHIPQDTILLSAGGCPLTSNVIAIGTFVGPNAIAGSDTTVCNTAAVKQMGTTATSGWVYSWTPSSGLSNTTTANPTAALNISGTRQYIVTVQNPACPVTASDTAIITVNPIPTATITGATTVCRNTASPNITFTGTNGTPPYTFTYKVNGGTNQTISTSAASSSTVIPISTATATTFTYNLVSVQESSSTACAQAQTGTVVVTVLPAPGATITGTTSLCNGATSPNITFTASNGTAPYKFTYNINNGSAQTITASGTNTTVAVPTNTVGIFTYSLTGVQDVNLSACGAANGAAIVTVNPLPTATVTGTTTLCKGSTSPVITFTGANATPPYTFTYNISGAATQTISTSAVSSSTTIAAPTGTVGSYAYNLTNVKDGSSTACTQTVTVTATIVINAIPTASITGTANRCLNDPNPNITFTGFGTTPPYVFTYSVSDGTTLTVNTATTSVSSSSVTVSAPTNVGGTFTYSLMSVQDGSSTACSQNQTGTAVVTVNPMGASLVGTTTVCQNSTAPTVTFTGGGGVAPYTFTYSMNGGTNQTIISNGAGVATLTVSTAVTGDYVYDLSVIQDNNSLSCVSVASVTVTVSKLPTASVSGTAIRCINGPSPDITFKGATTTGPYIFTYNINGGGNQTVTSLSGDSVNVAAPTTGAGTFTYNLVSVKDATTQTCGQNQTGNAVVTINPLAASIAGTTTLCKNATSPNLTFTGSGGTAPYTFTYNINGGSNQTITAAGTTTTIAAPTSTTGAYTYSITSIKDATSLNCVSLSDATIIVNPLPTATISGTTSICENGAAPTITFAGGSSTAPYTFTYNLNNGTTQNITTISGNSVTVAAPTNVTGAFTYSLLNVTDGSTQACSQTQTGSAVVTITPLAAIITGATIVCKDTEFPNITFTGSGGAAPYTFVYTLNGVSDSVTAATGNSSVAVPVTTTVSGTFNYSLVKIKDGNVTACNTAVTGATTVTVNPLPTASIAGLVTVCQGDSPAPAITFSVTGAPTVGPYTFTYLLDGTSQNVVSSGTYTTVTAPTTNAGIYTYSLVSIQDGNTPACSNNQTGSVTVTVNKLPTATISGTTSICENGAARTITFTGGATIAPYTFTYKLNGGTTQSITTVADNNVTIYAPTNVNGTFTYTLLSVKDGSSNACSQTQAGSAVVTVTPLAAAITGDAVICKDASSPNITFSGSGGAAPYTFIYTLNGISDSVKTSTGNSSIIVPSSTSVPGTFNYSLVRVKDGSATACNTAVTGAVTVSVNPLPTASIAGSVTVCQGDAAPAITFSVTGTPTVGPYTFTYLLNGATQSVFTQQTDTTVMAQTSNPGSYNYSLVSIQDSNAPACSNNQAGLQTVTVNKSPTATIASSASVCQNAAQPTITFTGEGGTPPYTFSYNMISNNSTVAGASSLSVSSATGVTSTTIKAPTADSGTYDYVLTGVSYNKGKACFSTQNSAVTVRINPLPLATMQGGGEICKDSLSPIINFTGFVGKKPYIFTFAVNDGKNTTIVSNSKGRASLQAMNDKVGTFNYTLLQVTDSLKCSQAITNNPMVPVVIHDNPYPSFQIDPEVTSVLRPTITITDASVAGDIYKWEFGDGATSPSKDPQSHTYADTGHYRIKLLVTTAFGCKDSTYQKVIIELPFLLYIPNSFSPNDDGVNDTFTPRGDGIIKYKMMIYDRWGNMIFYSDDINKGWDGKANGGADPAQMDTYVYVITVKDLKKHDYTYRGIVNLIK